LEEISEPLLVPRETDADEERPNKLRLELGLLFRELLLRLVDMLPTDMPSLSSDLLDDPKNLQGDEKDDERRELDLGLIRPKASVSILY
jgi:hypothetical protein